MAIFQLFFSVQGTDGSPKGQIRRIGWVIKTLEVHVVQFLLGCKRPVSRGTFVQEQDPFGDRPAAFVFPPKCPSSAPTEMSNTVIPRLTSDPVNEFFG